MPINDYETQLTGGHPNSLGNTILVVEDVLTDERKLAELFACYDSADEVVRLRVSNAMKRVCKVRPEWVAKYLDELISRTSKINQASTKWTLSTLFLWLEGYMTPAQRAAAVKIMQSNLAYDDWIVQNTTSEALTHFARTNEELKIWLVPELKKLTMSRHKSVGRRAVKLLADLEEKRS